MYHHISLSSKSFLSKPTYDPAKLFNELIKRHGLRSDAQLANVLAISPPQLSKMRNRQLAVGSSVILRIHLAMDMPVREIYAQLGVEPPEVEGRLKR